MLSELLPLMGFMLIILLVFFMVCVFVFSIKTIFSIFFDKKMTKRNLLKLMISMFSFIILGAVLKSNPEIFDFKIGSKLEFLSEKNGL